MVPEACRWMHNMHLRCTSFKGSGAVCLSLLPWSLILQLLQARSERFKLEPNQTKHTRSKEESEGREHFWRFPGKPMRRRPQHFARDPVTGLWFEFHGQRVTLSETSGNNMEQHGTTVYCGTDSFGHVRLSDVSFFFPFEREILGSARHRCLLMLPVVEHEAVVLLLLWQLAYLTGNLQLGWELETISHDFAWFCMILFNPVLKIDENTITWEPIYHI